MSASKPEPVLTAAELSWELCELGLTYSTQWVRSAWKVGAPFVLVGKRRFGRLSELLAWMDENPDVKPRAKRKGKR